MENIENDIGSKFERRSLPRPRSPMDNSSGFVHAANNTSYEFGNTPRKLSSYEPAIRLNEDIFERQARIDARTRSKLRRIRRINTEREMRECTFQPQTNTQKPFRSKMLTSPKSPNLSSSYYSKFLRKSGQATRSREKSIRSKPRETTHVGSLAGNDNVTTRSVHTSKRRQPPRELLERIEKLNAALTRLSF